MKRESAAFHLAINAIFIGILLSFAIFYLTNMLISPETTTAPACYDGTVITGDNPGSAFRRAVYQNESNLSFIREYQYRLFGIADQSAVVIGAKGFLFEVRDPQSGYEYLDDYTGNLSFSDEELAQILAELQARRDFCAQNDASYLLVVVPNSQTVYSEYIPSYLGRISDETRLTRLKSYLNQNGFYDIMDLTSALKSAKHDGQLYHNTENSLNALGLYYSYLSVCNRIAGNLTVPIEIIGREDLDFYRHTTPGLSTAQKAGLAEFAGNRTVSLSNDLRSNYHYVTSSGLYTTTRLVNAADSTGAVLLQFSDAGNRAQSEYFFSCTLPQVTYQNRLGLNQESFNVAKPQVVVQFIYESELSRLLP